MARNENNYFVHEYGSVFFGLGEENEIQNVPENGWDNNRLVSGNGNNPKHREFAIKSVRLSSYRNFPNHIRQTKECLAEAGFFYSGRDDLVYCFFCGQGLKSWEPNDDPWTEHARWAPKCVHLRNVKGEGFIKSIQGLYNKTTPSVNSNSQVPENNHNAGSDKHSPSGMLMNTIAAESLIKCGYERTMVRKAIKSYTTKNGNSEFKATDIVSIIFDMEDGSTDDKENNSPKTSKVKESKKAKLDTGKDTATESKQLLEENKQLKEQTCCKICLEETVSIVFLPCGHLCSCAQCAPALQKCPMCRTHINGTIKTFLS